MVLLLFLILEEQQPVWKCHLRKEGQAQEEQEARVSTTGSQHAVEQESTTAILICQPQEYDIVPTE